MTDGDEWANEHDLETPDSIRRRFAISYVESRPAEAIAALSMPMERFRHPFTGAPTLGPLAILVDAAGPLGATSLGLCTLTYGGTVIGAGTVRARG